MLKAIEGNLTSMATFGGRLRRLREDQGVAGSIPAWLTKENPLSGGSLQAPTALLKSVKMQKFSPSSLVTMFSSNVK